LFLQGRIIKAKFNPSITPAAASAQGVEFQKLQAIKQVVQKVAFVFSKQFEGERKNRIRRFEPPVP